MRFWTCANCSLGWATSSHMPDGYRPGCCPSCASLDLEEVIVAPVRRQLGEDLMGAASWPIGWYEEGPDQWANAYGCSVAVERGELDGEAWASIKVVVTIPRSGVDGQVAAQAAVDLAHIIEQLLTRLP